MPSIYQERTSLFQVCNLNCDSLNADKKFNFIMTNEIKVISQLAKFVYDS